MLTFPITTPYFHSRVLSVLSAAFSDASTNFDESSSRDAAPVVIEELSPADSQLTPDDSINSIIGTTSSWIDLGSPDPIIADISRQVLRLELAYAAFCGVTYVIIHGPRQNSSCDVAAYARAVLNGLDQGPYMQLYIWTDTHSDPANVKEQVGDLASFARREYTPTHSSSDEAGGLFERWQAWDIIRSICRYSTRLNLGKLLARFLLEKALANVTCSFVHCKIITTASRSESLVF